MRSIEDRNLLMNNVEMLANMTGGRSVRLTGQADTAFASLNKGLSGYYRLGVQALPEDLDGKDHRIALKLSRPGASLSSYRRVLSGARPQRRRAGRSRDRVARGAERRAAPDRHRSPGDVVRAARHDQRRATCAWSRSAT